MFTLENMYRENILVNIEGIEFDAKMYLQKTEWNGDEWNDAIVTVGNRKIDISQAVEHAAKHGNKHNEKADERHTIVDMWVHALYIKNGEYYLHIVWKDCFDCERGYNGIHCRAEESSRRENACYLTYWEPEFYF